MITTVAFDADDTLWHNERFFQLTQARFAELLADHAAPADLQARLLAAERRNLRHYGYGVKGFVLSMIETAIEVTDHRVPATVISELIAAGQDMLAHPIELLPHARAAVEAMAGRFQVMLITKGDLLDQERKLAQSGLGGFFDQVEIVSDKTEDMYRTVFAARAQGADRAVMIGNSMRSDVLPALAAGAWGVFVPHDLVWDVEAAEAPQTEPRYREIRDLGHLPGLIDQICAQHPAAR